VLGELLQTLLWAPNRALDLCSSLQVLSSPLKLGPRGMVPAYHDYAPGITLRKNYLRAFGEKSEGTLGYCHTLSLGQKDATLR